LFLTGYGLGVLPDKFRTAPILAKPYELSVLEGAIDRLLQSGSPGQPEPLDGGCHKGQKAQR
jgi:hypothetical protein